MKKVNQWALLLLMIITSINFIACSNDDENDNNAKGIVGKWGDKTADMVVGDYYLVFTFTADGKCSERGWTIGANGDSPTESESFENYKVEGNTLYVEEDGEYGEIEIVSLTSNQLVLKNKDDIITLKRIE